MANFEEFFGSLEGLLTPLALIAVCYSIYSFYCAFFLKSHFSLALRLIAVANFSYCVLTAALVYVFFERLTVLGVTYFVIEIAIIVALAFFEFRLAKQNQ